MVLFKYWNVIGSLTEIEEYVRLYEDSQWNCEPITFQADVYGLVSGRHKIPVNDFLLDKVTFGPAYYIMEKDIAKKLKTNKTSDNLVLYVTGYTPAVIAAINAAKTVGYSEIVLKHFDKDTGMYLCQWVEV